MKSITGLIFLALSLSLYALASGGRTSNAAHTAGDAPTYTIDIKDFAFTPRILTVPVGSKVTWTNRDEEPHKVAEVNSTFTSQPLDTDEGFTYRFTTPGTYEYFCTVHPRMTGKIIVENK